MGFQAFHIPRLEVAPADPCANGGGKDREQEAEQDRVATALERTLG